MAKKHNISFGGEDELCRKKKIWRKRMDEEYIWKRRNILDMKDIWCEKKRENEKKIALDTSDPG